MTEEAATTPDSIEVGIPKDLQDKLISLKILSNTHKLLEIGCFSYLQRDNLALCMNFLAELHGNLLKEAKEHPYASKVKELQDIVEKEKTSEEK